MVWNYLNMHSIEYGHKLITTSYDAINFVISGISDVTLQNYYELAYYIQNKDITYNITVQYPIFI